MPAPTHQLAAGLQEKMLLLLLGGDGLDWGFERTGGAAKRVGTAYILDCVGGSVL